MPDKRVVFQIDRPHFEVKLHSDSLEVNLKEGVKHEIEKLAEARPILQETLGWMFQTIIPLNVRLWEIEQVEMDSGGKVNLKIPHRRDLHIPLDQADGRKLVDKLNELIPAEKARELERIRSGQAAELAKDRDKMKFRTPGSPS